MATVSYVVTGYNRDSIIVKVVVGDKTEFINLQWSGNSPIEEFLKFHINIVAWRMSQTKPVLDYASVVGKSGNFEIKDPSTVLPPPAPPPKGPPQ